MAADGSLSSLVKWGEVAVHLKDFTSKHEVPSVVKVIKGQYRNIGVAKSVHSELYLHSVRTSKKVLAEGIKIKEGKTRTISADQKFSLPLSYQGWFELLSEDGKAIKAIQSVQELLRVFPQSCLVRENVKVYVPRENGELSLDKMRTVTTGEQLTLVGDMSVTMTGGKGGAASGAKRRVLRCFDQKGESVYFAFDQKGLFSPIAGQGNISGVHNIRALLEKFRMPIMVRLVHGIIPSRLDKNSFTGVFRLLSLYSDETAFVCPLVKEAKMVPISTREPLKLSVASNFESLVETEECKYFHQRCSRMIVSYMNSIHVLVSPPDMIEALVKSSKEDAVDSTPIITKDVGPKVKTPKQTSVEEDILFDEIEDIYQYVRDGGKPPPPRPRPSSKKSPKGNLSSPSSPSSPSSQPPLIFSSTPIETKHQTDDNYWEEPIYEDINKFRRKSGAGKDGSSPNVIVGTTVTVDTGGAKGYMGETMGSGSSGDSRGGDRRISGGGSGQVENLRQMYKLSSEPVNMKVPPDVTAQGPPPDLIPPVPPKRFDLEPEAPKPVDIKVGSRRLSFQGPNADAKVIPSNNTNNHRASLTTVNSPTALNANHLVYHRPGGNRISVGGGSTPSPSQTPPYVAVARVTPTTPSQSGASDENSQSRFVGGRVENAKRKLQSMYL